MLEQHKPANNAAKEAHGLVACEEALNVHAQKTGAAR